MKRRSNQTSISNVFVWQFLSQFFLTGISILTTPVFTRLLSTEDYGKFSNYNSWVVLVAVFAGLQTSGTISNAKVKYQGDDYRKYLSSITALTTISYLLIFIITLLFRDIVAKLTLVDVNLLWMMIGYSFATYIMSMYSQILLMDMNARMNALIAFTNALLTVFLSIVLIQSRTINKYYGRIYGTLIPAGVIAVIEAIDIIKKGNVLYKSEYWKYCLKLSTPLIFHAFAGTILSLSDRIMLTRIAGEEANAIYSVAYSIGAMVNVLWTVYNTTWIPFYYQYKKNKEYENINNKLNSYLVTFTLLVGIFVLCIPEIYKLMLPKKYWIGLKMIPIVVIGYYLNFMYSVYGNFEFYHERTKMISIGTISSAIINIILNQLLITKYGIFGAAIATAVSYGLLFIFHYIVSTLVIKEYCEIKISKLLLGLIAMCIIVVLSYIFTEKWLLRWIFAIVIGLVLLRKIISQKSIM